MLRVVASHRGSAVLGKVRVNGPNDAEAATVVASVGAVQASGPNATVYVPCGDASRSGAGTLGTVGGRPLGSAICRA